MKKFLVGPDGDMFGEVADICFFYPSSYGNTSLDVLQPKCANRLGKRLLFAISSLGGWFLRGVHHYMAQAMIVLLVLHLMQVVIDGAYRAPRELNFGSELY